MRRRTAVELVVLAILAAAVLLLFLNYLEPDAYPVDLEGSDPRTDLPAWTPPLLFHPCAWCELCFHRFEVAESRLRVTVTDVDGWHRLFWSAPETYVYEDPALVGAALRVRTSRLAGGTWTIRGRYAPVDRPEPHPCPAAPSEVDLRYRLHRGAFPEPAPPAVDPSGSLIVPRLLLWFRHELKSSGSEDLWWELENPESFAGASRSPCACGQ